MAGSKLFSVVVAVISPLTIADMNVELIKSACDHGFTVVPTICPMAGSTSPFSLASTFLQANTEAIFVAALTQIIRPGNPFIYSCGASVANMQNSDDRYYTLDKVLWKIAGVQLARSYNIPVIGESGGTMTWRHDQQSGAEGILFMLSACAANPDI